MNRTYVPYPDAAKHVHFKGNWASGLVAAIGDEYANDGALFVCILGHTTSAASEPIPDVDEAIIGPTGPTGPTGATGLQGPKGDAGIAATNLAWNEALAGTKNGVNKVFTIAHTPAGEVMITLGGVVLMPGAGNDYTISGTTVTLLTWAPESGDNLLAFYAY